MTAARPAGLAEVMELARSMRIVLLCYERRHRDCHRSINLDLAAHQHNIHVLEL